MSSSRNQVLFNVNASTYSVLKHCAHILGYTHVSTLARVALIHYLKEMLPTIDYIEQALQEGKENVKD